MSDRDKLLEVLADIAYLAEEAGSQAFNAGEADIKSQCAAIRAMAFWALNQHGEGA